MKYTEKLGNGYLTYESKDLKKCAPSSFLELIFMFITVFYAKKILDLFDKNEKRKIFVLIMVMFFLSKCFEGGNLTEEYYLPFAMISEHIFFKYLLVSFLGVSFIFFNDSVSSSISFFF